MKKLSTRVKTRENREEMKIAGILEKVIFLCALIMIGGGASTH
jgi:uncharacterized protein with ACT and thioredoxin-like domain